MQTSMPDKTWIIHDAVVTVDDSLWNPNTTISCLLLKISKKRGSGFRLDLSALLIVFHSSVAVTARIIRTVTTFLHIDVNFVLLVTAHVGVAHEVHCVAVTTYRGRQEVQFDLGLLLQGQALDGQQ